MAAPKPPWPIAVVVLLGVGLFGGALLRQRSPARQPSPAPGLDNHRDGETGPSCGGEECNALALSESSVPITARPGKPPTATGGVIPPGEYVLVESTRYGMTNDRPESERMTLSFEARGTQTLLRVVDSSNQCERNRENRLLRFEGTAVTSTRECPPCPADNRAPCENGHTYNYSWDGHDLIVIVDFGDGPVHVRKFRPLPEKTR